MIAFPNCKINLGLHVVGQRPDGYHDIETLFLPVHSLRDELEISESSELQMQQEGIALDSAPADNLCLRAWQLLHEEFAIPAVSIRLKKGIPFGAGLGGGSSDAAFTLKMLNEMFSLCLTEGRLEQLAARLGADCAFFVRNRPACATGIGERLDPFDLDLEGFRTEVALPPEEHVSTREAYAGLDRGRFGQPRPDLRQAARLPVEQWRGLIVNDFEASVFPAHPAIAQLKEEMYRHGAAYASMSGSGAAVYGIFPR